MPCPREPGRGGEPRGAGPDDRDAFPRRGCDRGELHPVLPLPVGDEPLELADGEGPVLHPEDADPLALDLLGTDPPADRGEHVLCLQDPGGRPEVAIRDGEDEGRDVDGDRAAPHAAGLLAGEAPGGLLHGLPGGEAGLHLGEISREAPLPVPCHPLTSRPRTRRGGGAPWPPSPRRGTSAAGT
jgi:hypothetical protein